MWFGLQELYDAAGSQESSVRSPGAHACGSQRSPWRGGFVPHLAQSVHIAGRRLVARRPGSRAPADDPFKGWRVKRLRRECVARGGSAAGGEHVGSDIASAVKPELILDLLQREGKRPAAILNTHGHADHIGGNAALKAAFVSASPRWFAPPFTTVPAEGPSAEWFDEVPISETDRLKIGRTNAISLFKLDLS
jgi:hypothetical protein